MKYKTTVSIGFSIITGFLLGYFTSATRTSNESPNKRSNSTTAQNTSNINHPETKQDPGLTEQIESMSAMVTDLQDQLKTAQFKSARYDNAQKIWEKYSFGGGVTPGIFKHGRLVLSDAVINFFEWDSATLAEVERVTLETELKIRTWEAEQAVCTEATDNKLVFEIPKAPKEIQERYEASLESIIGMDDIELLISKLDIEFMSILDAKTATFSPSSPEKRWQQLVPEQDSIQCRIDGARYSALYDPNDPTFDRWVHLLGEALF